MMRFCLCIFESDTVENDCPVQILKKMMKYLKMEYKLLVYLTSFTVFSGYIKKALKMTNQLVIFRAFFVPPPPLDPKSEKKIP